MNAPILSPVRFGPEDVAPAAALERLCFAEPWSERALELFLGPDAVAFAALLGNSFNPLINKLVTPSRFGSAEKI